MLQPYRRLACPIFLSVAWASAVQAETDVSTVLGRWCGIEGYAVEVWRDGVAIRPRDGAYAAPPQVVAVAPAHVDFIQDYKEEGVVVRCRVAVTGPETAEETCDAAEDGFFPPAGSSAKLRRCDPMPSPNV